MGKQQLEDTKEEYKIDRQDPDRVAEQKEDTNVPKYRIKLNLNEKQKARLTKEFFEEFDALVEERKELKLEEVWEQSQRQYDGKIKDNKRLLFNLHSPQSKIKVNSIVTDATSAFLEVDPKFTATPRPEFTRSEEEGLRVSEKQTDYIDYTMDQEIKPEKELIAAFRQSAIKYVGIIKLFWAFKREKRKREETYEGKNEIVGVGQDGKPKFKNEALKTFMNTYENSVERYPGLIRKLVEEKRVDLVVEYWDTIENNAKTKAIKVENFYVKNNVNGYDGLKDTHLIVEREEYTWWELVKKEKNNEFENIEEMKLEGKAKEDGKETNEIIKDYKTKDYNVLEGTYYFKLDESDDEEIKIKCWFGEDRRNLLGAILYPYYGFDSDYIPAYLIENDKGFYGDGLSVITDLKDSNIAQNAIQNLSLHGAYARNILTPIVKEGSDIEQQFLDNAWYEGRPLTVGETTQKVQDEIGFVQWPNMDIGSMVTMVQILKKQDSDVTRVTDLATGQESPTDPDAPAAKTIALLNQSGKGIKDYINCLLPSFNILGENILQLNYQMSNEGRKFRVRKKSNKVVGENVFDSITRDEMVAKTNIQSRATAFAFDKVNEKRENLAMMQLLNNHPYAIQQPKLLYTALLNVMKSWSPMWKNLADVSLPSPEEFQLQQRQVAIQAIADLIQTVQKQSEVTGAPPDIDLNVLSQAIAEAQQEGFNPGLREEREKQENKNASANS